MLSLRKRSKYLILLFISLIAFPPVWAGDAPVPSLFANSFAVIMIILMVLLMIVISILGNILLGAADFRRQKDKAARSNATTITAVLLFLLMLQSVPGFSEEVVSEASKSSASTIGGMSSFAFYVMSGIIFFELGLIIILLINIKLLLRSDKAKAVAMSREAVKLKKSSGLSWWDRINKLRPVSQEAELDLGHEYDGIRELNNKLPPWWLYGFYITIIFAGIYLWRFHVSHDGPSSIQEFETEVAQADIKIKEYLKVKGDAVDENTVTLLTSKEDLADGKIIFMKSCASCHTETGAGNVGPNLTDDYWLHGNNIKSVFKTIRYGINAMPQWQNSYSNKEMAKVASYVKSLHGTNPPNAKAAEGVETKEEPMLPNANNDTVKIKDAKIAMQTRPQND